MRLVDRTARVGAAATLDCRYSGRAWLLVRGSPEQLVPAGEPLNISGHSAASYPGLAAIVRLSSRPRIFNAHRPIGAVQTISFVSLHRTTGAHSLECKA